MNIVSLTSDLKKDIKARIKVVVPTVAENGTQVDTSGVDLYCFYNLISKGLGNEDNRASKTLTLQVDLWYTNADQNMTSIDSKSDDIEEIFNECSFILTNFDYFSVLTSRNDNLNTGDENMHHNQLLFEVRYNRY
jgi:hypothetical protein